VQRFEPEGFPSPGPLPGVTVPDLMAAATLAEAQAMAEAAGLNLVTTSESHFSPAGTLLRQEPPAGSRVNAGNAVILYVSDGTGEVPTVPTVVGMDRATAEQTLRDAGYEVLVFTRPTNNPAEDGIVLSQSPSGGEAVPPGDGTTVVIQVGVLRAGGEGGGETETPAPTETPTRPGRGNGGGGGG
jgi:eukaryotic-like serine/threonine-protein kinase